MREPESLVVKELGVEPEYSVEVIGGARGYGVRARGYGVGARGYGTLVIIVSPQSQLDLDLGLGL